MQPCFEQEKHQYHENRLEHFKGSCLYGLLPVCPVIYIPNGGMDFLYDSTTQEHHVLSCRNEILKLDWNGHFVLGIHLDENYEYSYREEEVEMFLKSMQMLGSWSEKLAFCDGNLRHVIERRTRHPVLLYGMQQTDFTDGCMAVEEIANDRGYSVRQLERLFQASLHITPKQYGQYCRLRKGIEKMKGSDFENFSRLSASLGYSNASHFQREFKRFFQMTPKEFKEFYL